MDAKDIKKKIDKERGYFHWLEELTSINTLSNQCNRDVGLKLMPKTTILNMKVIIGIVSL